MWKRIPHLMQQHETSRKEDEINKLKHFIIIHTSCYNESLKEDELKN